LILALFYKAFKISVLYKRRYMTKQKAKVTNKAPEQEPIRIGPCSPMQELVFKRATEVDFMIIGGSRGK
jgi:hypothetical protein